MVSSTKMRLPSTCVPHPQMAIRPNSSPSQNKTALGTTALVPACLDAFSGEAAELQSSLVGWRWEGSTKSSSAPSWFKLHRSWRCYLAASCAPKAEAGRSWKRRVIVRSSGSPSSPPKAADNPKMTAFAQLRLEYRRSSVPQEPVVLPGAKGPFPWHALVVVNPSVPPHLYLLCISDPR